jgi:hypothetical protein
MELLERYLHEVGRSLPAKGREDILAELRSSLTDSLEGRYGTAPTDDQVVELLKETGEPRKVAASYSADGQYLIGPELYPFFRMVAGIVLAAVIGAQLIAFAVDALTGTGIVASWEAWLGLFSSIPSALGSVVIVFFVLQRVGVKPDLGEKEWDPRKLPEIPTDEKVKRGDHIVGIIFGSIFIGLLAMPEKIAVYQSLNGPAYSDPVLVQNAYWLIMVLLAGIGLDAYLLWQERWTIGSRVARIAISLFQFGVLAFLFNAHNAWLSANGVTRLLPLVEDLADTITFNPQVFAVEIFRMVFLVAMIVTIIQTIVELIRLVRTSLTKGQPAMK